MKNWWVILKNQLRNLEEFQDGEVDNYHLLIDRHSDNRHSENCQSKQDWDGGRRSVLRIEASAKGITLCDTIIDYLLISSI